MRFHLVVNVLSFTVNLWNLYCNQFIVPTFEEKDGIIVIKVLFRLSNFDFLTAYF